MLSHSLAKQRYFFGEDTRAVRQGGLSTLNLSIHIKIKSASYYSIKSEVMYKVLRYTLASPHYMYNVASADSVVR